VLKNILFVYIEADGFGFEGILHCLDNDKRVRLVLPFEFCYQKGFCEGLSSLSVLAVRKCTWCEMKEAQTVLITN